MPRRARSSVPSRPSSVTTSSRSRRYRSQQTRPLSEVEPQIRSQLSTEQQSEEFSSWLEKQQKKRNVKYLAGYKPPRKGIRSSGCDIGGAARSVARRVTRRTVCERPAIGKNR